MNLAGSIYTENAPYNTDEPFFYIVSFTDDYGDGQHGEFDLLDNSVTLTDAKDNILTSILEVDGKAPQSEQTVKLPGDDT